MEWYQWLAYGAFGVCAIACLYHFLRLIRLGKPNDMATPSGSVKQGIVYSFTSGMSPKKKESAFLHLPTYVAGMLFHLGIFLSLFLFFLLLFIKPQSGQFWWYIPALLLVVSSGCGVAILIKRSLSHLLRDLSNPDDYISNLLVTLFQAGLALYLLVPSLAPLFYLTATLLWLYFPLGKLKHAVYFFAARYHLGFFFGSRGVWSAPK